MADTDAIFIGGPNDGTVFDAPDSALVEVTIDDLVHRYIRTNASREQDGRTYRVFNYDGEIRTSEARREAETSSPPPPGPGGNPQPGSRRADGPAG